MTNYISKIQKQIDELNKSYKTVNKPDKNFSQYLEKINQRELSERMTYPMKKTTFSKIRYVQE